MNKSIRWLKYSIGFIVLIIAIVSLFNFKVDSLGLFGNSNYLSKAAKALTSGKMIAGLQNIDDRLFQDLIIKNLEVQNDIIAIGSSTSMMLRKQFLSKDYNNFFNHSVSGASIEDYIAITGAYESFHGYLPSTIIFGIDPWIFNKYNGQRRWRSIQNYYDYQLINIYGKELNNNTNDFAINTIKFKQLINFDYSISNLKFFIRSLLNSEGKKFYVVDSFEIDDFVRVNDGSIHYPFNIRHRKNDKVKEFAIKFVTEGAPYSLAKFNDLSNVQLFEDFVKYLKYQNVDVIFLLPPYNPITYDLLEKNTKYKNISIVEEYLNTFAKLHDFDLVGSYNPKKLGLTSDDFFDGVHSRDSVLRNFFQSFL